MSSTAATVTTTTTATALTQTYWCHECDMSISLIVSSSVPLQVTCPYSTSHFLEPMDCSSHSQTHFLDFNFFLDYNFHDDDDDNINPPLLPSFMTTIQISDSASQESCPICKDEFELDSEAQQLPCKHFYHTHCIIPWLSLHSSCPLCRFQLPGEEDVDLADSSHLF